MFANTFKEIFGFVEHVDDVKLERDAFESEIERLNEELEKSDKKNAEK